MNGLNDCGYSWTPDSKRLLLSRRVEGAAGTGPEDEFFWISVEGGAPQPIGIRMRAGFASNHVNGASLSAPSLPGREEVAVFRDRDFERALGAAEFAAEVRGFDARARCALAAPGRQVHEWKAPEIPGPAPMAGQRYRNSPGST